MTITALEVSLNGKVLYTVGMEGWRSLGANIHGHRLSEETLDEIRSEITQMAADQPLPDKEILHLSCHVGIPDPGRPSSSTGQPYGLEKLAVGDEITIRIVKTDKPDDPPKPPREGKYPLLFANVSGTSEPNK